MTYLGFVCYNPRYNKQQKGRTMKDTVDSIIINAQLLALLEIKNKVQDKIDELERQKAGEDEIPF